MDTPSSTFNAFVRSASAARTSGAICASTSDEMPALLETPGMPLPFQPTRCAAPVSVWPARAVSEAASARSSTAWTSSPIHGRAPATIPAGWEPIAPA